MMTPYEVTMKAVEALENKKATDVKVLHIADITSLAEYFVICTGTSTTHLKALSDEVEKVLEENGEKAHHVEGYRGGSWVLMDFGCLIVHLFMKDIREFYDLERLWKDGTDVTADK